MVIRILQIAAIFMIGIGATAVAREPLGLTVTPQSREQITLSFAPVVKQVSPAVVNIYTKRVVTRSVSPFGNDPFFEQFFGRGFGFGGGLNRQQVESSLGSGLIIDSKGVIITNAHVVKGAQEISVVLNDGREFDAKVSLSDEPSDLAVLRVDPQEESLPFASLKPSEVLEVGDIVIAIGNPFGVGQTVTSGIVSALARSSLNISDFNFFIQTDAAINPGNSGGPLVSMDGKVVGINSAIYSRSGGSLGIGFAIPSEMVATVIAAEKNGHVSGNKGIIRPWIGVQGQALTKDLAESMNAPNTRGVLISKLHKKSPAKKAGMQVGDIIQKVNNHVINDPIEMKFRLATVPIGEKAELTVLRKGKELDLMITAMAPPDDPPRAEAVLEGPHPLNGATAANLNPRVGVELGIDAEREGVVILNVPRNSVARGLVRVGDIILSINDDKVEDMDDLRKELEQAVSKGYFALVLERDGHKRQIVIR